MSNNDNETINLLERVLLKLAFCSDDQLEQVLGDLLIPVIGKLAPDNSPSLRSKVCFK